MAKLGRDSRGIVDESSARRARHRCGSRGLGGRTGSAHAHRPPVRSRRPLGPGTRAGGVAAAAHGRSRVPVPQHLRPVRRPRPARRERAVRSDRHLARAAALSRSRPRSRTREAKRNGPRTSRGSGVQGKSVARTSCDTLPAFPDKWSEAERRSGTQEKSCRESGSCPCEASDPCRGREVGAPGA
jgi:hypothetical protein